MSALNQAQFRTAAYARQYLEKVRWPNGPICPHCGVVGCHYALEGEAHREGLWKCKDCREQFTVTVGTVFERSKIALNVWLQAVSLLCSSKKGMSSHQLHRTLGVTYKTAWFMTHRIREAMRTNPGGLLGGGGKIVEADETYTGSEDNVSKRRKHSKFGHSPKPLSAGEVMQEANKVVSLVERGGAVRSFHVADVSGKNLKAVLTSQIHSDSHVMTDSSSRYNELKREKVFAKFDQVSHNRREYVRGIVSTNTVEGYFSILKRGIIGTYHHVSSQHLHRYVSEFDFRYNNREQRVKINGKWQKVGHNDTKRAIAALVGIGGKRLTYRRTHAAA